MSCVTPYRVWVSDGKKKLILKDTTTNNMLFCLTESCPKKRGLHIVISRGDLIYIEKHYYIITNYAVV